MKNNFTNADLFVGTAITFNDEGVVREDHVLGNYSLTSGEIRTAWAGMVSVDTVIEKFDDSFFIKVQNEVQRVKTLLGATDKEIIDVQNLIREYEYDALNYSKSRFTTRKADIWGVKYGNFKPKKSFLKILQTIDKDLMPYFYMSWFDYLFLDNMPPRLPQE